MTGLWRWLLKLYLWAFLLSIHLTPANALAESSPDWSDSALIPSTGRENLYQLSASDWQASRDRGLRHTLSYPVTVTGVLIPKDLLVKTLVQPKDNLFWKALLGAFKGLTGIKSFDDFERLVGLVPIADESHNLYQLPKPETQNLAGRYGTSFIETDNGTGITFSCATCHVSQLFGVPVFGLQNRFPHGNEFFIVGKKAISLVEPHLAAFAVGAAPGTAEMLKIAKKSMGRIESRKPMVEGLDTSLAHVALSLSRRSQDEYASFSKLKEIFPREERLRNVPSDSKPGTWWNLKYKNKWLLDGSVVSGNPIFTNILWNEIGRGTDLHELEAWLDQNPTIIEDLTNAVFAAEPPRYSDFFRADSIDLASAKRGQRLFQSNCSRCHGQYDKAWDEEGSERLSLEERLMTSKVRYFSDTPVVDVGTDASRREGMKSLLQLNNLAIARKHEVVVKVQEGYVPPPLVGIWARWPYFHNNSVPTLCAVLTRAEDRPKVYIAGEAEDPATDFDKDCNGYPALNKVPSAWTKVKSRTYDTHNEGMSNKGNDEGVFLSGGEEIYSPAQKKDIIEFLKTL
jgi:cytochrome c5